MKHTRDELVHAAQATYLEGIEQPRDALLQKMEAFAGEHRHPISDPEVAAFLAITIGALQPKRIVEVGTNIGYGAIVMARAAGPACRVVTIEKSRELCDVARAYVREAKLEESIEVREADAIEALESAKDEIDFAYVDCVKEDYPRYLALLAPRLRRGGVLVADNVLWRGLVAADDAKIPDGERARVTALRAFNRALVTSPDFRAVILPLGDGVAYAIKN
jgi:predicted O-methyltransferase YrrM